MGTPRLAAVLPQWAGYPMLPGIVLGDLYVRDATPMYSTVKIRIAQMRKGLNFSMFSAPQGVGGLGFTAQENTVARTSLSIGQVRNTGRLYLSSGESYVVQSVKWSVRGAVDANVISEISENLTWAWLNGSAAPENHGPLCDWMTAPGASRSLIEPIVLYPIVSCTPEVTCHTDLTHLATSPDDFVLMRLHFNGLNLSVPC